MPATVKGIVHVPAHSTLIKPARRETLLTAIAKARQWVDDMAQGRTATFARLLAAKARSNGTCGYWHRWLSCRPGLWR